MESRGECLFYYQPHRNCSEVIALASTTEVANLGARNTLFTGVVYTNQNIILKQYEGHGR